VLAGRIEPWLRELATLAEQLVTTPTPGAANPIRKG
jgi:hypothetical protein